MENRFLDRFNNIVVIKVKTRNMERFLTNLYKLNIDIFNVNVVNFKEVTVEVYERELNKIKKLSILNKIDVIDYKGKIRGKKKIIFNKTLLFSLFIGGIILLILSNIIFNIEIVHTSSEIRKFIIDELNENGIKELQFRKSFNKLLKIKNNIL